MTYSARVRLCFADVYMFHPQRGKKMPENQVNSAAWKLDLETHNELQVTNNESQVEFCANKCNFQYNSTCFAFHADFFSGNCTLLSSEVDFSYSVTNPDFSLFVKLAGKLLALH
jgi:hypothetical protein